MFFNCNVYERIVVTNNMRFLILLTISFMVLSGCKKSKDCKEVIVTLSAASCSQIGVILDGIKYPTDDLPAQYVVDGKSICIEYSFWDDYKMCPCCGGRKVHVISVH